MANGSGIGKLVSTLAVVAFALTVQGGAGGMSSPPAFAADGAYSGAPRWGAGSLADPRRFASAEAEAAVESACASTAPFLVLDTFRYHRAANLDDDLTDPDHPEAVRVSHGDLVAAIAGLSHARVTAYQIDPVFNAATLARDMARLAADIESGRIERPAAVISSIVLPVDLDDVNRQLGPSDRIAHGDISRFRAKALDALAQLAGGDNPYRIVRDAMASLRARGVPVFVAAGNTAPDRLVNMLALNEGVYAIGALGADGRRTDYTSTPDLVSVWTPGQFVVTETEGGVGLNRDREPVFRGPAFAEEKALIARYVGRLPAEVVIAPPPALAALPQDASRRMRLGFARKALREGLYPTADLLALYGYPSTSGHVRRSLQQGAYMHYPSDTIFSVDRDGRLAFDPLGDGRPGQLAVNDATSFAAPNVCASGPAATRVASGEPVRAAGAR
ncbi:hypothetical protein ACFQ4O_03535 [Methylopila musalis]|uniref:Uncharacterized protein n=1 Tax=Methylopila musalis TaxID=1134781 RepID=A0ABW3Z460_9HYPH